MVVGKKEGRGGGKSKKEGERGGEREGRAEVRGGGGGGGELCDRSRSGATGRRGSGWWGAWRGRRRPGRS